jgi:hypothetical protein
VSRTLRSVFPIPSSQNEQDKADWICVNIYFRTLCMLWLCWQAKLNTWDAQDTDLNPVPNTPYQAPAIWLNDHEHLNFKHYHKKHCACRKVRWFYHFFNIWPELGQRISGLRYLKAGNRISDRIFYRYRYSKLKCFINLS